MPKIVLSKRRIVVGRAHPICTAIGIDTMRALTLDEVPNEVIRSLKLRAKKIKFGRGYRLRLYSNGSLPWEIWFDQFEDGKVIFQTKAPDGVLGYEFLELLENNLGSWALKAKFTRLDVYLSVPLEFREFFNGLDFGKKRAVQRYKMTSRGQSFYIGIWNGRKHELLIYDKRRESQVKKRKPQEPINHPCTRIEINTRPKKGMLVSELPLLLTHRPFKHVRRFAVTLIEPALGRNKLQNLQRRDRFIELKTMLTNEGFFMARRILNIQTKGNFHALYGDFYELKELTPTLDELFAVGMKKFFKK